MDINDLVDALNKVLDLGDQLDDVGSGVQGLTDGQFTTREACKLELSQFLLYIADGCSYFNDAQVSVLSLVCEEYTGAPGYKAKELAKDVRKPDPSNSLTLTAFQQADAAIAQQNGDSSVSLVSILVSIYEAFGQIMVAVNENPVSKSRYDEAISKLRMKLASDNSDGSSFSSGSDRSTENNRGTGSTGGKTTGAGTGKKATSSGSKKTKSTSGGKKAAPAAKSSSQKSRNEDGTNPGIVPSGDDNGNVRFSGDDSHSPSAVDGKYVGYEIKDGGIKGTNKKLTSIEIPDGVTSIDDNAFKDYKSLTEVIVPASVRYIGNSAFSGCGKLEKINIPEGIDIISFCLFEGCKKLETVSIPETVTSIESHAFSGCKKLTGVVIPASVEIIGSFAFDECQALTQIEIPEGIKTIGRYTFSDCTGLTSVTIPGTVTSIGIGAFSGCKKLKSIAIPAMVEEIGQSAFSGCQSLTRVEIPEGVETIDGVTFLECTELTSVTIPETVTSIGSGAFRGCKKLKSVTIPASVNEIGESAFNECQALTRIEIPEGVKAIGSYTFSDCTELTSVTLPSGLTAIGAYAFDGCKNLERINIPTGIEELGDAAFGDCGKLTEIVLPTGLTAISDNLFEGCSSLKNIVIPSAVTAIGTGAFIGCVSLTTVRIPETVTAIGDAAFMECSGLKSITLPKGIEAINDCLFDGCSGLLNIIIPESVETIGDRAFNACTALTEVTIPDNVKSIGDMAFDECTALKSASLPGGVELGICSFLDEVDVTYRLGNGRTTKRKPDSPTAAGSQAASSKSTVGRYRVVMPSDELYSHYGRLKREADKFKNMGVRYVQNNGEEFQALQITRMLEEDELKNTDVYRMLKTTMSADSYDLHELALKMAQVFRVNESVFKSRYDDEGDIHECLMDKKWKLSALRSFAWTLADLADREGKSIDDYDYDELVALCSFIEEREWLNYEEDSWFDGLCGHPDIHVFYMPGKMVKSGEAEKICDVLNLFHPVVSLDAFRNDLSQIKNAIIKLHNGILRSRDRNEKLDTPAAAVLQAWCVMAVSAENAFFNEDGPMFFYHSYPSDTLNTKEIPVGPKMASLSRETPKPKTVEASSDVGSVRSYEIVKGTDGKERIKFGEYPVGLPITWLVLEKNGQELLLLSEYALDAKPFCEPSFDFMTTNEWHGCTLRTWLNDDFYAEAFSDEERKMILDDTHATYKKSEDGEENTPDETDRVFLLSAREVGRYFPQVRDRACKASAYAKKQGAEIEGGPDQCSWWLRSPAVTMMGLTGWAPSVRANGSCEGWGIACGEVCVRPVVRVKLTSLQQPTQTKTSVTASQQRSVGASSNSVASSENSNAKRIKQLEESIDALQREADSTGGLFGFVKRNKLKKEIEEQQRELESLRG